MKFEKGQSGNKNGRPRGTRNKISRSVKEELTGLFTRRFRKLVKDMDKLSIKDQFDVLIKILPWIAPRLASSETRVDIRNLSEDQINTIVEEITNNLENNE